MDTINDLEIVDYDDDYENNKILRIFINILDDFLDSILFKTDYSPKNNGRKKHYLIISNDYNFLRV